MVEQNQVENAAGNGERKDKAAGPPARSKGRPAIDDTASLRRMDEARRTGQAQSDWAAACVAAHAVRGHSYEADVWRLYKKHRQAKRLPAVSAHRGQ